MKEFISGQILTADELNAIVEAINIVNKSIPDISPEEIEKELKRIQGLINEAKTKVADLEQQVSNAALDQLKTAVDKSNQEILLAQQKLEKALKDLEDAKQALNSLIGSGGDAGIDIMETIGNIKAFAEWYDQEGEYVVKYQGIVDAQQGFIKTSMDRINAISDEVMYYTDIVNTNDGLVKQCITDVKTVDGEVKRVETELNVKDAKWTITAADVNENKTKIAKLKVSSEKIDAVVTGSEKDGYKIAEGVITENSIINQVSSIIEKNGTVKGHTTQISQLENNISLIAEAFETDVEGNITDLKSASIIAAITEGENNTLNSNITLSANTIALVGETVVENLKTLDLTVGGGSSEFKLDGSGYVANGHIAWDPKGNVRGLRLDGINNLSVNIPLFTEKKEITDNIIAVCRDYDLYIYAVIDSEANIYTYYNDQKSHISNINFDDKYGGSPNLIYASSLDKMIFVNTRFGTNTKHTFNIVDIYTSSILYSTTDNTFECKYAQWLDINTLFIIGLNDQHSIKIMCIKCEGDTWNTYHDETDYDPSRYYNLFSGLTLQYKGYYDCIAIPTIFSNNIGLQFAWLEGNRIKFNTILVDNLNATTNDLNDCKIVQGNVHTFLNDDPSKPAIFFCKNKVYKIIAGSNVTDIREYGDDYNKYKISPEVLKGRLSNDRQMKWFDVFDYEVINGNELLYSRKETRLHSNHKPCNILFVINTDTEHAALSEHYIHEYNPDQKDIVDVLFEQFEL